MQQINYVKLKKDMDQDGDFLHWDANEKVSITSSGAEDETDYRILLKVIKMKKLVNMKCTENLDQLLMN